MKYRNTSFKCFVSLLIATLFLSAAVFGQSPIAVDVSGDVGISVDGKVLPVKAREQLTGDKLIIGGSSSVMIVVPREGRLERLAVKGDAPVEVGLSETGAEATDGLAVTKIPAKLSPDMLAGLPINSRGAVGQSRGFKDPAGDSVLPVTGSSVLSNKPVFSWPAQEGAIEYQIKVMEGRNLIFKKETDKTTLESPVELEQRLLYTWEVIATQKNGDQVKVIPVGETSTTFQIASKRLAREVEALQTLLKQVTREAKEEEAVVQGMLAIRYEALSLFSEAIEANERVVQLNPKSAASYATLFELYQRAGRMDDAEKARQTAEALGYKFADSKSGKTGSQKETK